MGDFCFVKVNIRYVPEAAFEGFCRIFDQHLCEVDFPDDELPDTGARCFEIEEVDSGGYTPLGEIAALGVVFSGSHEAGDEYPAYDFVTHDGVVLYTNPGGPSVPVSSTGEIKQDDIEEAMNFHKAIAAVNAPPTEELPKMVWPVKEVEAVGGDGATEDDMS